MAMSSARITWGITERSLKLIPRYPSTFIPSLVMPLFFLIAFAGAFSAFVDLPGFPAEQMLDWVLPMSTLQGCAFAGITTGIAVARDLENGFFDRFIMSPAPRRALVAGPLLASVLRASFPLTLLPLVGLVAGVNFHEGLFTIVPLAIAGFGIALVAGMWSVGLALRARSQQAAPLMQMAIFLGFFLSTAQMPMDLLTGWVHAVARFNPITNVLEMARQGFLGEIYWDTTWPGLVSLAGMILVLGIFAARGLRKIVP
jgi:ABC-2 type transport system permease protein